MFKTLDFKLHIESPLLGLIQPMSGLLLVYNTRRALEYLYKKHNGENPVQVTTKFGLLDGLLWLGGSVIASHYVNTIDIGQSTLNTLAVYGALSLVPEVSSIMNC